jgi:hypothetical protein
MNSGHDAARIARDVEFAREVFADRGQIEACGCRDARSSPGLPVLLERPNAAADGIAKNSAHRRRSAGDAQCNGQNLNVLLATGTKSHIGAGLLGSEHVGVVRGMSRNGKFWRAASA